MQSGAAKEGQWVMEYELQSARRAEPIMGWVSSNDTLNQVNMKFDKLEDAIAFARAKGWHYSVTPEHKKKLKPRNYADNFKYKPVEE